MLLLWSSYVWVGSAALHRAPAARVPVPDDDEDVVLFAPPPEGWRIVSPRKRVIYRSDNNAEILRDD